MRLDLFLKASRLVSRRAVAQALCEANMVEVGGVAAKSSRAIKEGDEISVRRRNRVTVVRILSIPTTKQVSRYEATQLYEILSDTEQAEDVWK